VAGHSIDTPVDDAPVDALEDFAQVAPGDRGQGGAGEGAARVRARGVRLRDRRCVSKVGALERVRRRS
jgi:hypothetical protein